MTASKMRVETSGLVLCRKPVQRALSEQRATPEIGVVREGSTGRVVTMLPRVWAVAAAAVLETRKPQVPEPRGTARPKVEVAFYRKYTEALLRRYLKLSMEAGRVPSLLGRELFRGHVTSYKVKSFEDVVIFCHDVETCLAKLNVSEKELIRRVALQSYSQAEAAAMTGSSLRSVVREYAAAIDRLTAMFMERRMLETLKSCQ